MIDDLVTSMTTWAAVTSLTSAVGPAVSVVSAIRGTEHGDPLLKFYCSAILKSARVRAEVDGIAKIPDRSCVFVCNHQSHFDAPLILLHLPRHTRFVAKSQLFKIPIFGHALKATGNIRVDRTGSEHDKQVMQDAIAQVRDKTSVMFFAEGTRSDDGVLRPFKKGAATLAIQAQVPIVPLAVAGTRHILPKGSALVHGHKKAVLLVGEPISTEGKTLHDRDALTQRAHDAVAKLLDEANARVAAGQQGTAAARG